MIIRCTGLAELRFLSFSEQVLSSKRVLCTSVVVGFSIELLLHRRMMEARLEAQLYINDHTTVMSRVMDEYVD